MKLIGNDDNTIGIVSNDGNNDNSDDNNNDDDSYGVDLPGAIHTLLQGYSGGISIVREMTQNADDPDGNDDRWLEFHFHDDALIMKNNTLFRSNKDPHKDDFKRIKRVASGNKAFESHKTTGAFGVGFISVYQITDIPILRSSGKQVHFLPEQGKAPTTSSNITDHTEFELPYRREATPFGNRIGMPPIDDEWVKTLLTNGIPQELPYLLLFLRRLNRISIFQNGELLYAVQRTIADAPNLPNMPTLPCGDIPEYVTITLTQHGEITTHQWLRFTGCINGELLPLHPDGRLAKDGIVQFALPDKDMRVEDMPGRLCNYLPTDISTKLPFQINGDFYPTTDRKNIDLGHSNNREWNERVLQAIGTTLTESLPYLLDYFHDEPLQLYHRLPIRPVNELVEKTIRGQFLDAVRSQSLAIYYTHNGWRTATDARWVRKELRPVVNDVEPHVIPEEIQSAAWEIININIKIPEYTLNDFLTRVQKEVTPGQALKDGPPYLHTIEQLKTLYRVFGDGFASGYRDNIATTPVFLDHTQTLWQAAQCVRFQTADDAIPEQLKILLNSDSGLHFLDFTIQQQFSFIASLVSSLKLKHMWDVLQQQLPPGKALALHDAPKWLNDTRKLYSLYRAIAAMNETIKPQDIQLIPLCLNRFDELHPPTALFLPDSEPVVYDIFDGDTKVGLVAKKIYDNKEFNLLYERFGVQRFSWKHVVERMAKVARDDTPLAEQPHPCLQSRERLLQLYRYLNDKRSEIERDKKYVEELHHRAALWLCRDGKLRLAKGLALPTDEGDLPTCITTNNVIAIESKEGLHPLFRDVLHLDTLTHAHFIEHNVLPQYAALSPENQMEALHYMRGDSRIRLLEQDQNLLNKVKDAHLIVGNDGTLHRASELCFPNETLRQLFAPHVLFVDARYVGSTPLPEPLYEWHWYRLFSLLGVHEHAPRNTMKQAIEKRTAHQPTNETCKQIEDIFRYIEERWERHYTSLASTLCSMAWLPADGDLEKWYKPNELYPRPEKQLVDQVAKVIGFREARRAKEAIANALGFPSAYKNIPLVVKQLLALSQSNKPANSQIYQLLGSEKVSKLDIQPLQDKQIFWDEPNQRYWKAADMLQPTYRSLFGNYRGYLTEHDYYPLHKMLGATGVPTPSDYVDLICTVGEQQTDNVPDEDAVLIRHAYDELKSAPNTTLARLKAHHSVLSRVGDDKAHHMRKPDDVILQPPARYREYLPDIPIAQYNPNGVTTLEHIGVRTIDDVLKTRFESQPDTAHHVSLSQYFQHVEHPLKRVLYHYNKLDDAPRVWEYIKTLTAYEQRAIRVTYEVGLANRTYTSTLQTQPMLYDTKSNKLYVQQGLSEEDKVWELAKVVYQILRIENEPLINLLKDIIKDIIATPRRASDTLDRSKIKPLPNDTTPSFTHVEQVNITGDTRSEEGEQCTFTAKIDPVTATPPFTYQWYLDGNLINQRDCSATPTDETIRTCHQTFDSRGTYALKVRVSQEGHEDRESDTHRVEITAPYDMSLAATTPGVSQPLIPHVPPEQTNIKPPVTPVTPIVLPPPQPIPPTQVTIEGKHEGLTGAPYTFTTTVEPKNASQPLSYAWRIDAQDIPPKRENMLEWRWNSTGEKTIRVTVSNEVGNSTATHTIIIYPSFDGITEYRSPSIPIDWRGLQERVSTWRERHAALLMPDALPPVPAAPRPTAAPERRESLGANTARFTLSFPEVEHGFLRLDAKARALFEDNVVKVTCRTDYETSFDMHLDWQQNIAYSQPALQDFFAEQTIPAGGIVYLEKTGRWAYRLFYNDQPPRTVRHVRFASPSIVDRQATVTYEIIGEQEITCEIDEAIYRAEKRFEDMSALLIESIGKKAVVETMCDIFMQSLDNSNTDGIWLHKDDLDMLRTYARRRN